MPNQPKKEKALHGNRAKIDPKKQIASLYEMNRVTMAEHKAHETPIVNDDNVEYAKHFVEENKK
jgi:hypothetical protein